MRRRNISETESEYQPLSTNKNFSATKTSKVAVSMAHRDRTIEFMSVVKNRLRDKENIPAKKASARYIKGIEDFHNFMLVAKSIGKEISNTFTKLEKLTLLAKRRSLFNDKPVEIEELTYIIKEDINSINKQIAQLQMSRNRNSSHGKHMVSHSNSVVVSLQSKLATMSSDFKSVLEVRTENLKQEKNRRQQFTEGTVSATLPASALSEHSGSVLLSDDRADSQRGDFAINMDNEHFQQQIQLIDEQDNYLESRANTMENIESTIVELGTIFQQLAHMVKEQDELVQRIDSNVEDAQLNIEAAHSEILRYFQSVTNNRWLMVKIFAVLIVFFIIFVVFVA